MKILRQDLDQAAQTAGLTPAQSASLWAALEARTVGTPSLGVASVAYYFGALIVIGAMGFFMTLGFEAFGGFGIFAIASAYAVAFVFAGRWLRQEKKLRVPGGLLITMAVCMTPLAVYGLERGLGLWSDGAPASYRDYHVYVKASWIVMELATLATGMLALRWVRFPFLTAPIAFTLWYMSMDLAPLLVGDDVDWVARRWVSVGFGLLVLGVAFIVDRKVREDLAFWLYLFGLMAFWGGLSTMDSGNPVAKLVYCAINVGLMGLGVLLSRRAFLVFGALGVFGYLGYLSYRVFEDSMLFPFVLSAFGIAVIVAGVQFQKHQAAIEAWLRGLVPVDLLAWLPEERA
jgi:hypothetical protein